MKSPSRKFTNVAVLMGGPSSERAISLKSGAAVARGLQSAGYSVNQVDATGPEVRLPAGTEAVFIALHGEFGEDGTVQAQLQQQGIPYTGSGPEASRNAFDKRLSKRIFDRAGIPTAPYEILSNPAGRTLDLPVVVKPPCQGSTIGIFKVSRESEWDQAFAESIRYDGEVLVERFIPGRELTVGIIDGTALPVIEIVAPEGWYDFDAKYTKGQSRHLCPAPLEAAIEQRCKSIALSVFQALGCRGLGRVDFRLNPDGNLFVLELNNIPGFTETSLLPEAAAAAGIGFPELCRRIMEMATLEQ